MLLAGYRGGDNMLGVGKGNEVSGIIVIRW